MLSKFINRGYEADQCEICKTQFNLLYKTNYSIGNFSVYINVRDVINMYAGDVAIISKKYLSRMANGHLSHIGFAIFASNS